MGDYAQWDASMRKAYGYYEPMEVENKGWKGYKLFDFDLSNALISNSLTNYFLTI